MGLGLYDTLAILGQTKIDADRALETAAQFDALTYVLVLGMLLASFIVLALGGVIIRWGVLPSMQAKRERENRLTNSQAEHLKSSSENYGTLTVAFAQQTNLIADLRHNDERLEQKHDALHDKVDDHGHKLEWLVGHFRTPPSCGVSNPSEPLPTKRPNP